MRVRTVAAALVAVSAVLAGCSGGDEKPANSAPTAADSATTQKPAVKAPKGIHLTDPGRTLELGKTASVVYRADDNRRSVVTVRVKRIRKGKMRDFGNFSLNKKTRRSTPYYVDAVIRNDGPGGLSRAAVPLYGFDSTDTYFPPTQLVGDFKKCVGGVLPKKFNPVTRLAGAWCSWCPSG